MVFPTASPHLPKRRNQEAKMTKNMEEDELSPIQQFYKGRSIFITGGTGFVGRVLVEKLLRCCPGIGTLYLLMRPKKEMTPKERIDVLVSNKLFSRIKDEVPSFKDHIVAMDGDLLSPRLGISDDDMEKLKADVSVVIHSGARINYTEPVSVATKYNVIPTKRLLEMCKEFTKIEVFLQVSTNSAYREADLTVPEYVPKYKISPEQLIDAVGWMDEESFAKATEPFVKEKYDAYCLTKALAENLVVDNSGDIPTVIVRPGAIYSSWKEPFPGWCDVIQGFSGLILGVGKGFVRALYFPPGTKLPAVPVDIVANTIIATAWYRSKEVREDPLVVNIYMDSEKLPYADELFTNGLKKREECPLSNVYRYPDVTVYNSWILYKIHTFFDHYIPAFFLDLIIYAFTGKTLMMPLYKKIEDISGVFLKFLEKPWLCKRDNQFRIMKSLSKQDSEMFFMDPDVINWAEYAEDCVMGGRMYLAHEDPETVPYARKKAKIWWFATTLLKWIILLSLGYFIIIKTKMLERLYVGFVTA